MIHRLYYVNQITLYKAQMVDIGMKPRVAIPVHMRFSHGDCLSVPMYCQWGSRKPMGLFGIMLNNSILIGLERHYLAYDVTNAIVSIRPTAIDKSHTIEFSPVNPDNTTVKSIIRLISLSVT